ncbi:uncharacterized protein LOC131931470 [Physella acuta]|uniref:uncharacterized protein LOC131931470 n=1 Tax=Physella acuta TaxID=109671 RepID=UPI0027DC280D|nr:uncharacterized protein LOC131931470 [Physella acuta]
MLNQRIRNFLTLTGVALLTVILSVIWIKQSCNDYENKPRATIQLENSSDHVLKVLKMTVDLKNHQEFKKFEMVRDILKGPHIKQSIPGEIPTTAHYVWCGDKIFTFREYLGVLSIVKVFEPLRIFFYYNSLPKTDGSFYHSWFPELKQSLANLIFRKINRPIQCNTMDAVDVALEQMASNKVGGFYVGERAVLTHVPDTWKTGKYFTYQKQGSSSSEDMIVFVNVKQGIDGKNESDIKLFKNSVLNQTIECYTPEQFDNEGQSSDNVGTMTSPCVVLPTPIFPENILNSSSPQNAFLRWLCYSDTQQTIDTPELVPLINHVIYLNKNPGQPIVWSFENYVNIISSLYLGGFERVYVHGDTEPSGKFWDRLKSENVTFVYVDQPYSVFQQDINVMEHKSDILRVQILYKYGGTYNDNDVIWVKPLSEDQRRHPVLGSYDWQQRDVWPRTINNGLIVARPKALFLSKMLETFKYFRDDLWALNSCYMYYKIYEKYPESFHIDNRLQVGCFKGICHPAWHDDFQRVIGDLRPTTRVNIQEANAFHIFERKPGVTFNSFSQHQNKTSIDAILVKNVMAAIRKAGKAHLVED